MSISDDLDRVIRYARDSRTRCRRAANRLASFHRGNEKARWLIGYDAGTLMAELQDAALTLAPLLNEDDLDARHHRAKELAIVLRKRSLAAKMADTTGRTLEEAAAFNRKREEMGASL